MKKVSRPKNSESAKQRKFSFIVVLAVAILGLSSYSIYKSYVEPDAQCLATHVATTQPPKQLKTATDFFTQGDYEYESGDCKKALDSYAKATKLNPKLAEAYNNRAYTNMRMQNYADAVTDLDKALKIRPNYVNALMNRGDIHNYYFNIDRSKAMADYNKVLSFGPEVYLNTNLCGHRLLAKNNGWNLKMFWQLLTGGVMAGCN